MVASIWTQVAAYVGCKDVLEALGVLRELGWTCFELSTEHLQLIEDAADRDAAIDRTVGRLEELGVVMPQAHAQLKADVAHSDEQQRAADLDRVQRNLRTCAALGVRVVVVHPGRGEAWRSQPEYRSRLELNCRQFRTLGDLAGELGLRIAIENMADWRPPRGRRCFGSLPCELLDLLDALSHPALGVCFDTSHARLQGLDVAGAVRELGPHLIATHLSDNDGSADQHRTPGCGSIDWPAVCRALGDVGYDGPMNLEIPGEAGPARELVRMKIRHALEVTKWLIARVSASPTVDEGR